MWYAAARQHSNNGQFHALHVHVHVLHKPRHVHLYLHNGDTIGERGVSWHVFHKFAHKT